MSFCSKCGYEKMFFLLLFMSINFTSCLAGQSEIYGTYEFKKMEDVGKQLSNLMEKYKENEKRREKAKKENSYGITLVELPGESFDVIYDAISIDSDSLIFNTMYLYTISAEELYYKNKELKIKCPDNLFVRYEPIIEGYLCNRIVRLGINSFEPVTNLDKQTRGSYPDGYKISYETKGGTPDFLVVFKHIKDKGKVLITTKKNKFIMERSHTGTGKSAKNYISEITEGYKKPVMEYKKAFEKELDEFVKRKEEEKLEQERLEMEEKQKAEEEQKKLVKECSELKKRIKDFGLGEHLDNCLKQYTGFNEEQYGFSCFFQPLERYSEGWPAIDGKGEMFSKLISQHDAKTLTEQSAYKCKDLWYEGLRRDEPKIIKDVLNNLMR